MPLIVPECEEDHDAVDQGMEDVEAKEAKEVKGMISLEEPRQKANVFAAAVEAHDTSFRPPTTHNAQSDKVTKWFVNT